MIRPELGSYDVLLVNTPAQDYGLVQGNDQSSTIPSLGIVSIASFLKANGIAVGVLDADSQGLSPSETVKILQSCSAPFVGFNAVSENIHIAGWIGSQLPEKKVVLGGVHASLIPEQTIARFPYLYALVHGEGEKPMLEIVRNKQRGEITGVAYMENGHLIINPRADRVDLNELPRLDRIFFEPNDEVFMMTSRGCPHNCAFCASPVLYSRRIKFEKMERIICSMLIDYQHGYSNFHFLDDQFLITEERARLFVEGLKEAGLYGKIHWRGMARADVVVRMSDEILFQLKESGGTKIAMGIESGCSRIIELVHKRTTNGMVKTAVEHLSNAGFEVKGFFILGFPTETYEEMRETRRFIMELGEVGLSYFNIAILRPYPGTEIYNLLLGQGYNPDEIFYEQVSPLQEAPNLRYVHGYYNRMNRNVQVSQVPEQELRQFIVDTIKEFEGQFIGADCPSPY